MTLTNVFMTLVLEIYISSIISAYYYFEITVSSSLVAITVKAYFFKSTHNAVP